MNKPSQDEYGEIYNSEETFDWITESLIEEGSVFIGWTDRQMTHLDLLFTIKPAYAQTETTNVLGHVMQNNFQRGMKPQDLFVSIIGIGAFRFEINDQEIFSTYYDEKFGGGLGVTASYLAVLINAVKKKLYEKNKI